MAAVGPKALAFVPGPDECAESWFQLLDRLPKGRGIELGIGEMVGDEGARAEVRRLKRSWRPRSDRGAQARLTLLELPCGLGSAELSRGS